MRPSRPKFSSRAGGRPAGTGGATPCQSDVSGHAEDTRRQVAVALGASSLAASLELIDDDEATAFATRVNHYFSTAHRDPRPRESPKPACGTYVRTTLLLAVPPLYGASVVYAHEYSAALHIDWIETGPPRAPTAGVSYLSLSGSGNDATNRSFQIDEAVFICGAPATSLGRLVLTASAPPVWPLSFLINPGRHEVQYRLSAYGLTVAD